MKFGVYTPNFELCGGAQALADRAYELEQAGWGLLPGRVRRFSASPVQKTTRTGVGSNSVAAIKKPLPRAAGWDGVLPVGSNGLDLEPNDLRGIVAYIKEHRDIDPSFDVIRFGKTKDSRDMEALKSM